MQMWRSVCLVASLVALVSAYNSNSISNNLKPSEWLSYSRLESLPALDEITFDKLESMTPLEGANLVNEIYHLSQLGQTMKPSYKPNPESIDAYVLTANGQKVRTQLNQLAEAARQQPHFGEGEVTVFITGLPRQYADVEKANRNLIQAYMQAYNGRVQMEYQRKHFDDDFEREQGRRGSSEEEYNGKLERSDEQQLPKGYLLVIDLGSKIENFQKLVTLDTEATGAAVGEALAKLTAQTAASPSAMHIVGQGIAAHVAGEAGRKYTRETGQQLRRITALDASRLYSKRPNKLVGLARGDAKFVDAIHTSAYGMGVATRLGDVDFYPAGPSVAMPGTDNIIEASLRATRYFAESLRPGQEHNFPAEAAVSLEEYWNNKGHGRRTYMGIGADYDVEGDFMLEVNGKSPFGKRGDDSKRLQRRPQYAGVNWSV